MSLAEYLLSMADAFQRFMPGVKDIASRTMTYSQMDEYKAGVVEGDLGVTQEGLVLTNELVPAFKDARLGALFITGSLLAPNATLAEPDIDWSPLLKVKGNVVAKNLCLGGSASEIDGDVTVTGVLMGYYNHGQMRIRGKTRALLVLVSDYEFIFDGPVERKYVASSAGRLNIPVDYDNDRLDLILAPEVIDETNSVHDGVVLDRLKRNLPILRPEGEIGTPAPPRLSDMGAARLAELRARKERGEPIEKVSLAKCELRFVPEQLRGFSGARELVLSGNRVKQLPSWIGDFEALETLGLEDCGLDTLPREIAGLPRLRKLELTDNPITSLPFGPDSFRSVEILTIGEGYFNGSAVFTANLDLSQFPWLRVLQQHYDINTIEELEYHDSDEYWDNPHLEILDISWPALKHGIPAGLLRARNLRALATRVNAAQLGSVLWRLPSFERLEYLAIGYTDLSRAQLARLHDGLPRAFISCEYIDGKGDTDFSESEKLWAVETSLDKRRFTEALAALDDMVSSLNLRRPLMPLKPHARLMALSVKVRRVAAEEEQDRPRREAMAEAALKWADRVLSVLPTNAEACWYLDYHQLWLVRLQCLYGRATGFTLRAVPDAPAANAALDLAQSELDRFLLPVNPDWHATESAVVRTLRIRIPG
ncbi:leucine-rich repeat domain-containing protein [Bradyrhizobium lablabi]|nr:hypothetical protein [Bradyrhizobium lablabi]